jgi:hypothetical protein
MPLRAKLTQAENTMSGITGLLIILIVFGMLAYRRSALPVWTGAAAILLLAVQLTGNGLAPVPWLVLAVIAVLLNLKPLRRAVLSKPLLGWFKSVLPPMSSTILSPNTPTAGHPTTVCDATTTSIFALISS